jgi:hypothetical protein
MKRFTEKVNFDVDLAMWSFIDRMAEHHEISKAEYLRKIVKAQMPKEDVYERTAKIIKP